MGCAGCEPEGYGEHPEPAAASGRISRDAAPVRVRAPRGVSGGSDRPRWQPAAGRRAVAVPGGSLGSPLHRTRPTGDCRALRPHGRDPVGAPQWSGSAQSSRSARSSGSAQLFGAARSTSEPGEALEQSCQRRWQLLRWERSHQQGVADLAGGTAAEPSPQLVRHGSAALGRLLPHRLPRAQLAGAGDESDDAFSAERADQFVLEIAVADLETSAPTGSGRRRGVVGRTRMGSPSCRPPPDRRPRTLRCRTGPGIACGCGGPSRRR